MPRDLVPELHDILKLTNLQHNFSDFDRFQACAPSTPTWQGVLQHHCKESFIAYPTERDTFLLHMADGMAANFSRHQQDIAQDAVWAVHRLWNPQLHVKDERLTSDEDIRIMLGFLAADPTFDAFHARYRRIFEARPEDARPGMNVTTLETHVRLVGRFYRFLRQTTCLTVTDEEVQQAATRGVKAVAELRRRKGQEWHLHLVRCRPRPLPAPFRARDMNIFRSLEEFLHETSEAFSDNLLFASPEELILYSDDLTILDSLRALAAPRAIALDIVRKREPVGEANLQFETHDHKKPRINPQFDALYPTLEATVSPPLCEVCQMRQASRVWPDDYLPSQQDEPRLAQEGKDHLCDTCFSIRARPSTLRKLAHRDEWAKGDVIWARFGLDFQRLHECLSQLYLGYLRSLDPATPESKAEVRFSLMAEFQKDYESHLRDLHRRLLNQFGADRLETILPDFFCIKANTGSDVFSSLRCFSESAKTFFPALPASSPSPLQVSVAFSAVNYPFFEIWRQWEQQESELEITAVGHGELQLAIRHLERFLQLADFRFSRSALHNLAEISRISQELAELRFGAKRERGERETFEHLGQFLPLGLTFRGILTLAKLVGS